MATYSSVPLKERAYSLTTEPLITTTQPRLWSAVQAARLEAERLSTFTLLESMVISLPAIRVPLAVPSDVGWTPLAEMDKRMFSTDCSVRAVQLSHVWLKQLVVTLAGFQSSKTPAGKVVRAVHPLQHLWNLVPLETSNKGKETNEVQPYQQ